MRFHLVRVRRVGLGLLSLLAALTLAARVSAQATITFELVPEARWNGGSPGRGALLEDGVVRLYEKGSFAPTVEGRVGIPIVVPPGTWSWIAEGEGYVSVVGSTLTVPEGTAPGSPDKTVLWPVVPACTLRLEGRWTGVERLDAVSLSRGAVYPSSRPQAGQSLQVPAGRWLVYGVRGGQLSGLGDPRTCARGEVVPLTAPSLPERDRQDVMLHLRLPEGKEVQREPPEVFASGPSGVGFPPTATVSFGRRTMTCFFHHLPASENLDLLVAHPRLRTVRRSLGPLGGSAREVRETLRQRSALVVEVDYRPRRPHRLQEIELLRCDGARIAPDDCVAVGHQQLTQGLSHYRFEAVDEGEYVVNARIDDELVAGLGANFWFEIGADAEEVERTPVVTLEEMEIWGYLLADGDRVPGFLRLVPRSDAVPVRTARADEDSLVYRLHYFAQQPDDLVRRLLPEELKDLGDDELRGLFGWYEIQGCDAAGRCRSLPLGSLLIGGGRLDFDLGASRGLDLSLVDAGTGEPLARVPVLVRGSDESRLVFHDGRQWWLPKPGEEASPRRTDTDGVARIRDLDPGEVTWSVKQAGYRGARGTARIAESGVTKLRVELERNEGAGDFEVSWPGGEPLVGAFVLVFEPGGPRRMQCSGSSNQQGGVQLRRGCLAGGRVVVLHPESSIRLADGDEIARTQRLTVERAPQPAPAVRVVGEDGRPIPGVPVQLELATPTARKEGPWTLGPTELVGALGQHLQPLFYTTDAQGLITLRGVDPRGGVPLRVFVGLGRSRAAVALESWRAGETVEVVYER